LNLEKSFSEYPKSDYQITEQTSPLHDLSPDFIEFHLKMWISNLGKLARLDDRSVPQHLSRNGANLSQQRPVCFFRCRLANRRA